MQSFDKRYNHQCDIQFMIYSFFTCKSMVFTNKSLLCNWESCLVSQLYWLKGPYNRFQTHKRFKRFEVYKSDALVLLFWKQNRWLSANQIIFPPGGKTIRLVPHHWVSTPVIGQNWNSQFSFASHHWVNTQSWVNPHRWGISSQNHINMGSKVANIFITS